MKPNQRLIIAECMSAYGVLDDGTLAKKLSCSKSAISNWRCGRRKIPVEMVMKTASETGVSLITILTGKSPPSTAQHSFSPVLFEEFPGLNGYIDSINEEVEAGDFEGAIQEMENCINKLKRTLKRKKENTKERSAA